MHSLIKAIVVAGAAALVTPAFASLSVFATVPEWAALAEELGGDKVSVYTATNGLQDPHHIEAKPSLIARARNAVNGPRSRTSTVGGRGEAIRAPGGTLATDSGIR